MKKYKLIKEYPGSPKLGTEVNPYLGSNLPPHYNYNGGNMSTKILVKDIENSSEYWQEVTEVAKDYEILSFIQKHSNEIWLRDQTTVQEKWSKNGHITTPYTTDEILVHDMYSIHSVKRLSDGEVFTVGDNILTTSFVNNGKIDKIIIAKNLDSDVVAAFSDRRNKGKLFFCVGNLAGNVQLNDVQKAKQKLFTTEDGVDIFEDDKFFYISGNKAMANGFYVDKFQANKTFMAYFNQYKKGKFFSTKEKAEEYILHNKPCLSFKDVVDYLVTNGYKFPSLVEKNKAITKNLMENSKLKELAKEKLNMK